MYWVGMRLLIRRLIQFVSGAALASSSTCTSGGVIDSVADTNKPDSKLHRKQSCVSVQWTELQINMASHPHPAAGVSVDKYFGLNHFTLPVRLPDTFSPLPVAVIYITLLPFLALKLCRRLFYVMWLRQFVRKISWTCSSLYHDCVVSVKTHGWTHTRQTCWILNIPSAKALCDRNWVFCFKKILF